VHAKKTIIVIAAILIGLASANAGGERIDSRTACSVAAKAFDTKDLVAVKEVGDYIGNLFSRFSENVGQEPGIAKMVEGQLIAIVIDRCRKFPNRSLEYQTRLVFSDWRTKADFWDERPEK
jgi:hypothetical protein